MCRAMINEDLALDISDMERKYRSQERVPINEGTADTAEPGYLVTLETFEATIAMLSEQSTRISALEGMANVGVMLANVEAMKRDMLPVPRDILLNLKVCVISHFWTFQRVLSLILNR
jgi:hypothetical protein